MEIKGQVITYFIVEFNISDIVVPADHMPTTTRGHDEIMQEATENPMQTHNDQSESISYSQQ